jgi:nucleoside-diphosphate-sugar epimerase
LKRLVYLSTTGVMANSQHSEWVNEESEVGPLRPGSVAAWNAEQWLAHNCPHRDLVILRLAGIYGPQRVPNLESLRQQQPLHIAPDSYLNLIHVADIAQVVHRAVEDHPQRQLYLVSDGNAVMRRHYYEWICQYTGLPQPQYAAVSSEAGRGTGNKRVSNRRLIEDFDIRFAFPSFREGLSKLLPQRIG